MEARLHINATASATPARYSYASSRSRLAITAAIQHRKKQHDQKPQLTRIIVVMGVSGCGKSTIGRVLAETLQWQFADADHYHPASNIAKMAAGQPLTDADRWPWLLQLQQLIQDHLSREQGLVLACSALKRYYRAVLEGASLEQATGSSQPVVAEHQQQKAVAYVLLDPPRQLLEARLQQRAAQGSHFMPPQLLTSQLQALEYSEDELLLHVRGQHLLSTQQVYLGQHKHLDHGQLQQLGQHAVQQPEDKSGIADGVAGAAGPEGCGVDGSCGADLTRLAGTLPAGTAEAEHGADGDWVFPGSAAIADLVVQQIRRRSEVVHSRDGL